MTKILPYAALVATFFNTNLKFLFKQAAIFPAILLILMGITSAPRAAEVAPDPAGFDILGMKLGMSVEEIEAAIKAYNPSLTISISNFGISNPKASFGKAKMVQFVSAGQGGAEADQIAVGFTVNQPSRAFYIGRFKQYSLEQRPLTDNMLQQLREKYGPESANSAAASTPLAGQIAGRTVFEWGGDNAGKHPFQSCAKGPYDYVYTAQFRFGSLMTPGGYWTACGTDLLIELQPSSDPHLLYALTEHLTAHSIAADDIQKLMVETKAAQEQQRQQQEQKASGVKPPI